MKTNYNYFILIILFINCTATDESIIIEDEVQSTIYCVESYMSDGNLPINSGCILDTSIYCNIIQSETLMLSEVSKCWIPQYNYEIGKTFAYSNELGENLELTLTDKGHKVSKRVLKTEPCDDSDYKLGYCYDIEAYFIILENEEEQQKYYIEMAMNLISFPDSMYFQKPDERLRILKINENGFAGYGLRAEEFDDSPYLLSSYYDKLDIQSRTFEKVYKTGSYHYTKEKGLIALKSGQWVLDDE